jgi:hypothetical protein
VRGRKGMSLLPTVAELVLAKYKSGKSEGACHVICVGMRDVSVAHSRRDGAVEALISGIRGWLRVHVWLVGDV